MGLTDYSHDLRFSNMHQKRSDSMIGDSKSAYPRDVYRSQVEERLEKKGVKDKMPFTPESRGTQPLGFPNQIRAAERFPRYPLTLKLTWVPKTFIPTR